MSDILALLNQIPQAERSGETGRALARLIANRAAAKFERSHEAQESIAQYNKEAYSPLPGDQPRGPMQEPNIPQLMQQQHQEPPTEEEFAPEELHSQLEALHRMRGGGPVNE